MTNSTAPYEQDWDKMELSPTASWAELTLHMKDVEKVRDSAAIDYQNAKRDLTVLSAFLADDHHLVREARELHDYYSIKWFWFKELFFKLKNELTEGGKREWKE